jgi:hypothetical protein
MFMIDKVKRAGGGMNGNGRIVSSDESAVLLSLWSCGKAMTPMILALARLEREAEGVADPDYQVSVIRAVLRNGDRQWDHSVMAS